MVVNGNDEARTAFAEGLLDHSSRIKEDITWLTAGGI
jgi:hypothetical protein